jgi:hypothetical protein
MQEIKFSELEEKQTYIVEKIVSEKKPKSPKHFGSEFEENFEFETQQLLTIIKIELPFFVIKSRHGRYFVKLSDNFKYLKPSQEFVKALKNQCEDEY